MIGVAEPSPKQELRVRVPVLETQPSIQITYPPLEVFVAAEPEVVKGIPHILFCTGPYQWLLAPFAYMYRKYWGKGPVIVFGDELQVEMPEGFQFRQVEKEWDWLAYFGRGMHAALSSLDNPFVTISLPDMWPCRPCRHDRFESLERYMTSHTNVLRALVGVVSGVVDQGRLVDQWKGLHIHTVDPRDIDHGLLCGCLLWPSIWNREKLLPLLVPRSTIWDWEIMHSDKMRKTSLLGVWTVEHIYRYAHVLSRNNTKRILLRELLDEDRRAVKLLLPEDIEVIDR
jgi:hypothetical protein